MSTKKSAKQLPAGTFDGIFTREGDERKLPITFSKLYNLPRWAGISLDHGWKKGHLFVDGKRLVRVPEKRLLSIDPDSDYAKALRELRPQCMALADEVCRKINAEVPASFESIRYARQYVLETVIQILQDRV